MTTELQERRNSLIERMNHLESQMNTFSQTIVVHMENCEVWEKWYGDAIQKMSKLDVYSSKALLLGIETQQRVQQLENVATENKLIDEGRLTNMNERLKERMEVIEERMKDN
ncbi:MAG: hypothetical protein V4598_05630 [Bdellovibrionota bacterium]